MEATRMTGGQPLAMHKNQSDNVRKDQQTDKTSSQRYRSDSSAKSTSGMRSDRGPNPASEKKIDTRKSEVRNPVQRGGEKERGSDSSARTARLSSAPTHAGQVGKSVDLPRSSLDQAGISKTRLPPEGRSGQTGVARQSAESTGRAERTNTEMATALVRQEPQAVLSAANQPVSAAASPEQVSFQRDFPWELSDKDRRVIQLAKGLESHLNRCQRNFHTFLEGVVGYIVEKGKISEADFAKLLVLQELQAGNITTKRLNMRQFSGAVQSIPDTLTGDQRRDQIVTCLAHVDDLKMIRQVFEGDDLSKSDRSRVRLVVYSKVAERLTKALWEYARDKREELLGSNTKLTPSGGAAVEKSVDRFSYPTLGVTMLDKQYIHPVILKAMENYCKDNPPVDCIRPQRRKDVTSGWTEGEYKKTSDDLQVAKQQLEELRYNARSNVFVTDRKDCTEFEPVFSRYLRKGNHRLEDKDYVELIPRFLQAKKFYPTDSEGMGRKLLEIYTASKMNGMGAALEIWKGLSDAMTEKMKKEIVKHSVSAVLAGDQQFRDKLEKAEEEKKVAENIISREQKLMGKGGRKADIIKAMQTQRETRAAAEEAGRKAEDDEYYRTRMQSGAQEGGVSDMPLSSSSLQMQVMLLPQNTQQLESSKKQADKKADTSQGDKCKVGIKELGEERYLTNGLVSRLRHFTNLLAEFQPKEQESTSTFGKLFSKSKH
ncbi:hypothetical protein [Endozoicomonas elysicola]|uniref:Uncharacterized protein n=1 Tax=Endozoicomonas elysicola TaxID=305900 RepID=A0A081KD76_9GAMM|nr:hypothetical protein [Endozoicomonas elysicola]KEI72102.1 hypothetical protein GV64_16430 [Endozoicomonas elysicola]